MRFGAKLAHCRDDVKLNAHFTILLNNANNDEKRTENSNMNSEHAGRATSTGDGVNGAVNGVTAGIECGVTGKYVAKNVAIGARLGYAWSTTDEAKPIPQVRIGATD